MKKYEVIARRYRPRRFEEVVGQESIAQTLRGGILQERLAHAYLFCGPRGCGKTSMARIFAKALNCDRANDRSRPESEWAQPCDECSTCQAIHTGQDIDVVELDGASNRGIEDIRHIIESVNRPASRGRYKVYMIDEVHMLTREAFNALLKTLEEPPPHVKFVFATTEVHKIPDTVLSRCQRFDVQPIGVDDIVRRLHQICEGEQREADDEILRRIARYSKGGLRDSQTLLDQLMTYCGEEPLTTEDLDRVTGRVPEEQLRALVDAIVERRPAETLQTIRACLATGADASVVLEQVIDAFHESVVGLATASDDESLARLDRTVSSLQVLLKTASQLRQSAYPAIAVEVSLIKLARLEDALGFQRALEQLEALGRDAAANPGSRAPTPPGGPRELPTGRELPAGRELPPSRGLPARSDPSPTDPRAELPAGTGPSSLPPAPSSVDGPRSSASPSATAAAAAVSSPETAPGPGAVAAVATSSPDRDSPDHHSQETGAAECRFDRLTALWDQILIELQESHPGVAPFLDGAQIQADASGRANSFTIRIPQSFSCDLLKGKRLEICEKVTREVTGEPWAARVEHAPELEVSTSGGSSAPPGSSSGASVPSARGAQPGVNSPGSRSAGVAGASSASGGSSGVGSARPAGNGAAGGAVSHSESDSEPDSDRARRRPAPVTKLEHPIVEKAMKLFSAREV